MTNWFKEYLWTGHDLIKIRKIHCTTLYKSGDWKLLDFDAKDRSWICTHKAWE